jgi:serine/threonine-protein kinase SRPK3
VGQPPLDSIMATPVSVVQQMFETASDRLPERWQQKWQAMDSARAENETENNLQEWLEETYFDGVRREDLTRGEIVKVGALLGRLLLFEPSTRASAQEILQDPWLENSSWQCEILRALRSTLQSMCNAPCRQVLINTHQS